ncbi:hypothetical protein Ga0074812_11150 [Parafrankia irregularis]|uniref:Uncharacterized protein n=1 Tax=Parafrankia irregularis TaxID=795642 RepID=A0A0S4QQ66_9ACTN|nr:hypothetical protein Ga0074812_11150 [Parafrankia irregularis]
MATGGRARCVAGRRGITGPRGLGRRELSGQRVQAIRRIGLRRLARLWVARLRLSLLRVARLWVARLRLSRLSIPPRRITARRVAAVLISTARGMPTRIRRSAAIGISRLRIVRVRLRLT